MEEAVPEPSQAESFQQNLCAALWIRDGTFVLWARFPDHGSSGSVKSPINRRWFLPAKKQDVLLFSAEQEASACGLLFGC